MWQRGPEGEVARAAPPPPTPASADEGASEPAARPRKRASIALALRLGLRDTYDSLGTVLLISVLWSVLLSSAALGGQALGQALHGRLPGQLPLLLAAFAVLAGLALVGGPLLGGIFRYARNVAARREPEVLDLLWGFRSALRPSLALGALHFGGVTLLAGNAAFYFTQRGFVPVLLGTVFAYTLGFWLLMMGYQWPLLVGQEDDAPAPRVRTALRKSVLLLLDNTPFTLVTAGAALLLSLVVWLTMVGGVLLWAGALAMLQTHATRELLRKYEVLPPDPTLDPIAAETHELGGHGRHE